ncbi:DUF4129 domain-containing protein [Allobranchiibius huperziae]|uniref:Protein-glutamine gamma-glutamyltransferase-like C-terminal domain-containing protein n=1 Tax=Allobranchiibius huperziae TaxID=1874116 RepID=A0A853DJT5_9MICO|nr:DUF4129 domain-containing protein [Allobranchiibius huperziae]NYJ75264.1 hypothetical protein [Allobranchiibius huperziae]
MVSGGRATHLQRRVTLIAVGVAVLVLALLAATTRRPAIVHSSSRTTSSTHLPTLTTRSASSSPAATGHRTSGGSGLTVLAVLVVLLAVLLLVLVIAVLAMGAGPLSEALRRRWDQRRSSSASRQHVGSARSEVLTESLPDLLRAVEQGSPRAGIIAAWVRLEGIAADAGVPPHRSETPAELTIRVLDGMDVPGRWILRLADLYREARFSDHPMSEDDRAEAVHCLNSLTAGETVRSTDGSRSGRQ